MAYRLLIYYCYLIWNINLHVTSSPVTQCPSLCHCYGDLVKCSSKNLTEFPSDVPENTRTLLLDGNSFGVISKDTVPFLPYVEHLYLNNSGVTRLENGSFTNLPNLQILDLSKNQIELLTNGTFKGLNLTLLNIGGNKLLSAVDKSAFAYSGIRELYINNCALKQIQSNIFSSINNLYLLDLSDNPGITFSKESLEYLNLQKLNLRRCDLLNLSAPFSFSVSELYLDDNTLGANALQIIININGLTGISLQNTGLQYFLLDQNAPALQWIDLSRNNIIVIPGIVFSSLPSLQRLIWSDNGVQELSFNFWDYVPMLEQLDLSNNRITNVAALHLNRIKKPLYSLNLENNKIRIIPEILEESLRNIKELYLEGNPIHCNCEMLWFYQLIKSNQSNISIGCTTPIVRSVSELSEADFICTSPRIKSLGLVKTNTRNKVYVECVAEGDPPPTLQLLHLEGSQKRWVVSASQQYLTNSMSSSVIDTSSCTDTGEYKCLASNTQGEVYATIVVNPSTGVSCVTGEHRTSSDFSLGTAPGVPLSDTSKQEEKQSSTTESSQDVNSTTVNANMFNDTASADVKNLEQTNEEFITSTVIATRNNTESFARTNTEEDVKFALSMDSSTVTRNTSFPEISPTSSYSTITVSYNFNDSSVELNKSNISRVAGANTTDVSNTNSLEMDNLTPDPLINRTTKPENLPESINSSDFINTLKNLTTVFNMSFVNVTDLVPSKTDANHPKDPNNNIEDDEVLGSTGLSVGSYVGITLGTFLLLIILILLIGYCINRAKTSNQRRIAPSSGNIEEPKNEPENIYAARYRAG